MSEPSARVAERVRRDFGGAAPAVLNRLRDIRDPFGREVSERVHAAVVLAAAGNADRLDRLAREAEIDWRDVLVVAGLAHEDWSSRMDEQLGSD